MHGNLIRRANIKHFNNTWWTRQQKIKKDGSEYFPWVVPVTAAAAISTIEIGNQFPRARKYLPLDWVEIQNNDVVDLTVIINGRDTLPVPAGTIREIGSHQWWQIGIRNDDAAIASTLNMIIVSLRRRPLTIDDWARRNG